MLGRGALNCYIHTHRRILHRGLIHLLLFLRLLALLYSSSRCAVRESEKLFTSLMSSFLYCGRSLVRMMAFSVCDLYYKKKSSKHVSLNQLFEKTAEKNVKKKKKNVVFVFVAL